MMKTITLEIEDDAHKELTQLINLKTMTGMTHEMDYQFILRVLFGIHQGRSSFRITKNDLEYGMKNLKK
jgi:hypothetical protein